MNKKIIERVLSFVVPLMMVLALGILNFSIIRNMFMGEFSQNIASIEISYIQMAKFWAEGGGMWQPLWYLGYPWHVFYTPILPFLEVVLHTFGLSFANAYRVVCATGYILAPITLFLFVWQISKSKSGAFVAAIFYSVVPSIIGLLFSGVAQDTMSAMAEPRRYAILVRWGEGPHTLALAFLPLFGLFFARFLEKKNFSDMILACLFLGLVALTNAVALWGGLLLIISFFLAELAKKAPDIIPLFKRFILTGLISFGFVAFWYNRPFISTFFREGGGALSNWYAMFPWGMIVLLLTAAGIFFLIKKFTSRFVAMPLAIFWFAMLFGLVFAYYASGDNHLEFAPQVLRLNTEVDMALGVLLGVIVSNIYMYALGKSGKMAMAYKLGAMAFAVLMVVLMVPQALKMMDILPNYAKPFSATSIGNITKTNEYRVAKKLEELTRGTNERVVAPGNYAFWLNYFVNVPQIRGALYQSSTHFWPDHIYYQLTNGLDGQISLAWLKIANVGKLVYTTAASGETYKDFKAPQEKFDEILRQNTTINGDIFYDVPLKNNSLAKVVDANSYKSIKKPVNAIDSDPIYAYLNWMEQKSDKKLTVSKISNSHLKIGGEVGGGEAVLVQQTYDVGWKAKGAVGWKVVRDPLGFMVLVPRSSGWFEVNLVYTRPWSVYLGYLITLATLVFIARQYFFKNHPSA